MSDSSSAGLSAMNPRPRSEIEAMRELAGELAAALEEFATSGIVDIDRRLKYVDAQISRSQLTEARTLLDRARAAGLLPKE